METKEETSYSILQYE